MIKTYNIQLLVSETSLSFWTQLLTQAMGAYNTCCNYLVDNNIPLGLHDVHEAAYSMLRANYPLLPAQSIVKIYKGSAASIRSQKSNFLKTKRKKSGRDMANPTKTYSFSYTR